MDAILGGLTVTKPQGPGPERADGTPEAVQERDRRRSRLLANLPAAAVLFDRDLRILAADGEALRQQGSDPAALVGRRVEEILPPEAFALIEGPWRAATEGASDEFDYLSPINGRTFRMTVRPDTDAEGRVVGGMALSVDMSQARQLGSQIRHTRSLVDFGSCAYDRVAGWTCDDALLALWGLESVPQPEEFLELVVAAEDRASVTSQAARARCTASSR
jgi:hypothetical protein